MERTYEKTTVPSPSVAAGGEQPSGKKPEPIIADTQDKSKSDDDVMREHFRALRELSRMNDPSYLHTVSMSDLYETVYESRPPIIDGLLFAGTYLFAGAPKIGKSFLMAQLAYHVSTGTPLWGFEAHQGTVLYENKAKHEGRRIRLHYLIVAEVA